MDFQAPTRIVIITINKNIFETPLTSIYHSAIITKKIRYNRMVNRMNVAFNIGILGLICIILARLSLHRNDAKSYALQFPMFSAIFPQYQSDFA